MFRLEYLEGIARARDETASYILLEEWFLARTMASESDAAEIDRAVRWVMDYVDKTSGELSGDYYRLLLRLSAPQIFHGNYDLAELMLKSVGSWIERDETDDPYFMMVSAGYRFNLGLLCFERGQEEEADGLFAEGLKSCTGYHGPSRHLVGHVLHWMMSYGVADNPDKAETWRKVLETAVDKVLQRWWQEPNWFDRCHPEEHKGSVSQARSHELVANVEKLAIEREGSYYILSPDTKHIKVSPSLCPSVSSPPSP